MANTTTDRPKITRSKSLREYVDALKQIGELQEVDKEVALELEIGAVARRCYETGAPAPLFNNIAGSWATRCR